MSSYSFRNVSIYFDAAERKYLVSSSVYLDAPEFARPIPVHAQTPAALEAVESVRRDGVETRLQRELAQIVTDHGRPKFERYDGGIPTNARKLADVASVAGFETITVETITGCRVEGYNAERALGFTATFERGRAKGATWNTPWRYGIVEDRRPIGVNAKTRTGLAKKRPAGVGTQRLAILGSPWGVPISHTELTERLQEEAS